MNQLRTVTAITRNPADPTEATLELSCGHKQRLLNFPQGTPPSCFRRQCAEPGCGTIQ